MKNKLLLAAIVSATMAVFASLFAGTLIPPLAAMALRWLALLLLAAYATYRRSLTAWILVGLLAGAQFGHDAATTAAKLQFLGTIFLRLIKVIIAPLLFGTLVVGIAGHADLKKVGRLGVKSLVYFEIVSTIALLIGWAAISLSRAGEGVRLPPSAASESLNAAPHTVSQLITDIFPENIAKSVAEGQVLQVVVFSILFAMALILVPEAKRRPMLSFAESLSETMFKFTNIVMYFAPVGVFGAVAYTVGHLGLGVLLPLLKLLATMYVALAFFIVCVLFPIALVAQVPVKQFLRAVTEPVTIAFATASSEAALPRAMEEMESFGVPRETVAFVLPTGYSFNLDGSSLYQSLALLFIAQAAGIPLSIGQQAVMLLTLLVSGKGTAGVARASLVIVLAAAASFHLPTEPLFLLFGIDQLMDMGRTAVNVLGNCLASVVVARWEGEFPASLHTRAHVQA
ncbi:MAG TPA: cation:dicarboxylase symporter family transporter [Candidatus Acidoferrum sp.]|jgi:proton glutamate symport protein|nr:cation:dicarboxylase symporter family transporter [Candidatus Acidoferrum sp.]